MDIDINVLVGAFNNVLRNMRKERIKENPIMVFWDTEFDEKGLISTCFRYYVYTKLLFLSELTTEKLYELVTDFLKECGVHDIRSKIYLITHFSIAELKHLKDIWRNVELRQYHQGLCGSFKNVQIIDSFPHFLCGLEKIGKSVGIPKIEIGNWITKMRDLLRENPQLFEQYAKRDVEVLQKAWIRRRNFLIEKFGVDILNHVTAPHTAINIFKSYFLKEPIEPMKVEEVFVPRKNAYGEWVKSTQKQYIYNGSRDRRYFALKSYWGGRREAFYRGFINRPIEIWDVKSMYPSVAQLSLPLQNTKWEYEKDLDKILESEGFVHCNFRFPETTQYPCLPIMVPKFPKLLFVLEGETWCTTEELRLALRLNCNVENVEAWIYEPTQYEEKHPLAEYIQTFMEIKDNSEKGSLEYETSKLMMNSVIGKFMQRDPMYSIEDSLDVLRNFNYDFLALQDFLSHLKTRSKLKKPRFVSPNWSPEWGALILGRARAVIGDFMATSKTITGHTDSIIIFKGSPLECTSQNLLKSVDSGIFHEKQYDGTSFWILRSAVYSPLKDSRSIKPTHHGYPTNTDREFGEIIETNLRDLRSTINTCYRDHIVTPKETLRFGRELGATIRKEYKISWEWDYKRKLLNPEVNIWSQYSETRPYKNIEELFNSIPNFPKKGRKKISDEEIKKWKKHRELGKTKRQIAKEYKRAVSTVSKYIKKLLFSIYYT